MRLRPRRRGYDLTRRQRRPRGTVISIEHDTTKPTAAGWVIGERYRVLDRLGSGGSADVFRARDELLGRDVAVKVFRTVSTTSDPSDSAAGARQAAEVRALARLSHPNLITLFDGSLSGRPAYLVVELVEGPSLARELARGPLPEPRVRLIGAQVADALRYVHENGLVHRDVKPANILLGRDVEELRARLSDFGIVRVLGAQHVTSTDLAIGTACYLAPEQARGQEVGPAADVYALGLVLLEMLTGVRTFDGGPLEAALARLLSEPEIPDDLPEPWPGLLRAMTAAEPQDRPTARTVAATLRGAALPVFGAVDTAPVRVSAPPVRRRRPAVLAGLAVLLAGAGAAAWLALQPTHGVPDGPPATYPPAQRSTPSARHDTGTPTLQGVVPPAGGVASTTPHPSPRPSTSAARTTSAGGSTSAAPTTAPATTTAPVSPSPSASPTSSPSPTGSTTPVGTPTPPPSPTG